MGSQQVSDIQGWKELPGPLYSLAPQFLIQKTELPRDFCLGKGRRAQDTK